MHYVSLGDSSAVGIGDVNGGGGYARRIATRLHERGIDVRHTSLGESGAVALDVVRDQVRRCAQLHPDLVTLGVGGNDLWQLVPVPVFRQQMEQIVAGLAFDHVDVVVMNIVDLSLAPIAKMARQYVQVTPEQVAGRVDSLNAVIADVVSRANADALSHGRDSRFVVVDICSASRAEIVAHPEFFAGDGFHPSARGYERFAALLWPTIVEALQRRGTITPA